MQKTSLALVGVLLAGLFTLAASCTAEFDFDDWDDIDDVGDHYPYSETVAETIQFANKQIVHVDNGVGSVKIETGFSSAIQLEMTKKTKRPEDLAKLYLDIKQTATSIEISTKHPDHLKHSKWKADYILKIPAGMGLNIDQGVGEIQITNYAGAQSSLNLGVGEVTVYSSQFTHLYLDLGVGEANLNYVESRKISASIGTGDLHIGLRPDASFAIEADVGMGDLSVRGFKNMNLSRSGFIGQSLHGVVGTGESTLHLHVGVGDLSVNALEAPLP